MGLMKRLLEDGVWENRPVLDQRDSLSRYTCRKCFEGFLQKEGRCCSCVRGRRRAKNMAAGAERDAALAQAKQVLLFQAMTADLDVGRLVKGVPKVKDYGFGR